MTFPLWYVLIPFGVFLFFFLLVCLFNTYHLIRYADGGALPFLVLSVYLAGTVLLLGGGFLILEPLDWMQATTISPDSLPNFFELPPATLK
ncbi:hypothetical protein HYW18_00605 [Candidatus Uhrbacteria bacterium]|nr:hypothetical protein [Candidatus Uhrbacteria bacterium]